MKTKEIKISEQYPAEIRDKRSALIPTLRTLRKQYEKTPTKLSLIKDTIHVNKRPIDSPSLDFETNSLPEMSSLSTNYINLHHTDTHVEQDSYFQGNLANISSIEQASAARSALFQETNFAQAKHLIYAYSFANSEGKTFSGYSDDCEIGGGLLKLKEIEEAKSINTFICVSRIKEGGNIGQKRFELIKTCANEAIKADHSFVHPDLVYSKLPY